MWSGLEGGGEKEGGNNRENIKWFWLVNCLLCPVRAIGGEIGSRRRALKVVPRLFPSSPTRPILVQY